MILRFFRSVLIVIMLLYFYSSSLLTIQDDQFTNTIDTFRQEIYMLTGNEKALTIPIYLVPLTAKSTAGVCYSSWISPFDYIEINSFHYYDMRNNLQFEWVILHELAHCIIDAQHISGTVKLDGIDCPSSIMNPYVPSSIKLHLCYKKRKSLYKTALKKKVSIDFLEHM